MWRKLEFALLNPSPKGCGSNVSRSKALYASAHPNVVQIHYACQDADAIYLVMPYYKKGSVKSLMQTRHLSVREIVSLGCQMLSGLHNIHSKKLVHFDIKPDNILLSERGEALVADFGLAKQINRKGVAEQDRFYLRMTPPEGFVGHEHDVTFDIYQVGLTLYRMCNGIAVFELSSRHTMRKASIGRPFDLMFETAVSRTEQYFSHIPAKLRNIIRKCLETDPQKRFQTALAVSNALADVDCALDWFFAETNGKRV